MKFSVLVLELHLPQNFLSQTDTDIFQKQPNRVQDVPKRVNPSKTGNQKFARKQYFLLLIQKKIKKRYKKPIMNKTTKNFMQKTKMEKN